MRHFRRMFAKLTNLFRRRRADHELDREVSAHLALLEDEFQRRGTSLERFVRDRTVPRSPIPACATLDMTSQAPNREAGRENHRQDQSQNRARQTAICLRLISAR